MEPSKKAQNANVKEILPSEETRKEPVLSTDSPSMHRILWYQCFYASFWAQVLNCNTCEHTFDSLQKEKKKKKAIFTT